MESNQYLQTLTRIFDYMMSSLAYLTRTLPTHDKGSLKEAEREFKQTLKASLPYTARLVGETEEGELDRRFLNLLPALQRLGSAMENLINRIKTKVDGDILFTDKGVGEVREVMTAVRDLVRDTKDVFVTANPSLKKDVQNEMGSIISMADNYALEHQQRLIVGVCTPQASYLYLDIMDSLKRMTKELAHLSEKA